MTPSRTSFESLAYYLNGSGKNVTFDDWCYLSYILKYYSIYLHIVGYIRYKISLLMAKVNTSSIRYITYTPESKI
jgi:hypothetical protein